ncbi:O-antigen ligase family protein [Hyphomonas sp.]|uniref:O-antigen ligase family protein n=1 Tax=Hyphomonas sp. TaxID=87 RepID=UPI0025C0F0DE|nr:O-antigen ligase family protein [Hyphomonas sp.]MBI1399417.1 hypothetical protein [Hyphomonas sp.]
MSGVSRARRFAVRSLAPVFLAGAVLIGGASLEGEQVQAIGFAVSAFLLAGLFLFSGAAPRSLSNWAVLAFCAALAALCAAQIARLPVGIVQAWPDRDVALAGLAVLGRPAPAALALSFAPEATVGAFLAFLMPVAGFFLIALIKWSRGAALLGWAIPLIGAASALLGLAQVFLGNEPRLYLYKFTSEGLPAGFFSNVNHQASFLLMCLPFVAAQAGDLRRSWEGGDNQVALAIVWLACFLLLVTGILGAGSVAGYILLAPVSVLSAFLLGSGRRGAGSRWMGAGLAAAIIVFAGAFVFSSPVLEGLGVTSLEESELSRVGIARTSAEILRNHWKFGTGLGTFEQVYHLYENPKTVTSTYVAHAHNDYLEWLIETGIAGTILLAVFIVWWLVQFVRVWINNKRGGAGLRRAASIACLVIVLHSFVDYPLRTPAIATLGAMCLALMVVARERKDGPAGTTPAAAAAPLKTVTL